MSPEQARGKSVDKRTDIWAFGCVLFEMLSGTMAFEGDTVTDTIAAILERDPDWSTLPADTPRAVRRLMQRCLEKDPKQRLRDIGDARVEIEQIIQSPNEDTRRGYCGAPVAHVASPRAACHRRRRGGCIVGGRDWPSWRSHAISARAGRQSRRPDDGRSAQKIRALVPSSTRTSRSPRTGHIWRSPRCRARSTFDGWTASRTSRSRSRSALGFRGAPLFSPDGTSISFIEGNSSFAWARPFLKASLAGGAPTRLVRLRQLSSRGLGT